MYGNADKSGLVEHVPRYKDVSRLIVEEFSQKDGFPYTSEIAASDLVVNSEATVGSKEFERCPICQELFPLPYLVDHAPNCTSSVSDLDKTKKNCNRDRSFISQPTNRMFDCLLRLPVL